LDVLLGIAQRQRQFSDFVIGGGAKGFGSSNARAKMAGSDLHNLKRQTTKAGCAANKKLI
jgi:hypothetical protein